MGTIDELVSKLGDKSRRIRRDVEKELVKIGEPAVEPLIHSLKDDCESVRWMAVTTLGRIGDARTVEPLIQAFKDEAFLVRWYASSALMKIGEAAVEPLLRALRDTDWETRYGAVRALGGIASTRAAEPLTQALEDENMEVRLSAAAALGNIGDTRAVQPLTKALKDDYMVVRLHAAEALGKIGDSSAVEPLLGILGDNHYAVRETAAISLTKLRESTIGPILHKLKVESRFIHDGRVRTRERKRYSAALKPLKQALHEGDTPTRMAAALALGMIGGPRPVEPLTHAVNNDKDKDVRIAAVQSLGKIGGTRAIDSLKRALNCGSPEVCKKALGQLALLRNISAVEPLLKALRDDNKEVRWSAAEDLGYIGGGNKKAEQIIRASLENTEDDIQREVAHALRIMEEEKEHHVLYAKNVEE